MKKLYRKRDFALLSIMAFFNVFVCYMIVEHMSNLFLSVWIAFIFQLILAVFATTIYIKNKYTINNCWEFALFYALSFIRSMCMVGALYYDTMLVFSINNMSYHLMRFVLLVILLIATTRNKENIAMT